MHVKTLCLGVLSLGKGTGYDIKKLFEAAFSHFQNASFGSIYPALKKLKQDGLVSCRVEAGDKHPDRKLFQLTRRGHEVLLEELIASPATELVRSDFLVQLFFAHLLPTQVLEQKLNQMAAYYQAELAYLESIQHESHLTAGMRYGVQQGIIVYRAKLKHLNEQRTTLLQQHARIPEKMRELVP